MDLKLFVAVTLIMLAQLLGASMVRKVEGPRRHGLTAARRVVLRANHSKKSSGTVRSSHGSQKRHRSRGTQTPLGASVRLRFLTKVLEDFRGAAVTSQEAAEQRHAAEEKRLHESIDQTSDDGVKLALQQSVSSNEQSLLETEEVYDDVISAADALSGLLSAASTKGSACETMTCGLHASCTETVGGAKCVCNEGYVGTGENCHAPPEYKPHHLLFEGSAGGATQALDINVCVFSKNKFAAVFRDAAKEHAGFLVVGTIGDAGRASVSPPEEFTQLHAKAFSPVVQGSEDKRILIAWRDLSRAGNGFVRAGVLGASGMRGAEMALTWGQQSLIATGAQAHKMALVSLPSHRFALMYSATESDLSFGNSILFEVGALGEVRELNQFRFSDFGVCRLEVAKISDTSFVIAARGVKTVDDMDSSLPMNQEAIAIFGEAVGNDLVFDPNAVNLEPQRTDIWARGISLIAPHTVAYAYQEGSSSEMKLAVLKIDPTTHGMEVVQSPVVVRNGFSPYVSMLNLPYKPTDPHTLIYYQMGSSAMVNLCAWSEQESKLTRCEDFTWLAHSLASVHGVHLVGGKAFMVFATPDGVPYYTVFGLSKK